MNKLITKKQYIHQRAKEEGKSVPTNYLEILKKIEKRELSNGMYLKFSWFIGQDKFINANSFFGKCIYLNYEYAFYFIFYDNDELENAFNISIGHELTHKEKHLIALFPSKKMRFMNWVNEVHADFGGAQKRAGSDRQKLLASINYKRERHQSQDDDYHPSWDRRESYVKNFDFGSKLIDQIAKDTGYNNQKFINKVKTCGFYNDIKLH